MDNSARLLRLGALANSHLLLSQLYSELLTTESDRRTYEIQLEIIDTKEIISQLQQGRISK